jgi:flagellar biosynthesis protein FliR
VNLQGWPDGVMFEISDQQLGQLIGQYLWPLFRIASFMMLAPILGTQIIPANVRLVISLLMTVAMVPSLPEVPLIDPLSVAAVSVVMHQVLIGLAMGFCVILLFQLFVLAGQMIAMQMGLGFAAIIDPTNGISVTALSQLYLILVTLVFLLMNGHLVMFEVVSESFRLIPISSGAIANLSWWIIASRISWMFASALTIALPVVTSLFIVTISFGVMTRAAPQMNIFSIGFPLNIMFGLLVFWVSLAGVLPPFTQFTELTFAFMRSILVPELAP